MIYIIYAALIIYGIARYDFKMLNISTANIPSSANSCSFLNKRNRYYNFLLLFIILMTGLSYRVGTDICRYMYDYDFVSWSDFDLKNLSLSYRQPFWILIQVVTKTFSGSFVLFRLLTSFFISLTFFCYIRKETSYVFTALLFYYIILSFDVNFNILRQACAMSSFILAIMFYKRGNFLAMSLLIVSAVLLHNSAFVLLCIPLLLRVNIKKNFNLAYLVLSLICISILFIPKDNALFNLLLFSSDDTLSSLSNEYLNSEYGSSSFSIVKIFIHLTIFYFISKKYCEDGASNCDLMLLFVYIVFFISSSSIPILGRIKYYFSVFYVIAVSRCVFYYIRNFESKYKKRVYIIIVATLLLTPVRYFFLYNPRMGAPNGIQYYPYYSVFSMRTSPEREKLVDY